MKKLFTLAAASVLAAGTLSAQAQVTLDGQLTSAEVTAGNYVLLGKFTNARGFGDWGLLSLYAASTPTKVYFFVGGNVESNGNAFQLFMNLPGVTGVPAGTALPAGTAGTSFEQMTAKMEFETDLALALKADGTDWQIEGAAYTSATAGSSKKLTSTAGVVAGTGTPQTLATTATVGTGFDKLAGGRVAYKNSSDGKVLTNPGNISPNTDPNYGGVGSYGWEIELDRTAMGLTGTPALQVFLIQNSGNGGYLSSDFIPQTSVPAAGNGNLATSSAVDFAAIVGRQYSNITLGANGALGTHSAAAAAMGLTVAPNPVAGRATISYTVANQSEQVRIALTDLLGREVRVLENGTKSAGTQTLDLNTTGVAAGTYLVKVQQGDRTATRKVVLL